MHIPPIAVLDLGTNTFNQLVATGGPGNGMTVLHSSERPVFLGRGIEDGTLTEEAMARGLDALHDLLAVARGLGVVRIRAIGTSALRHARNSSEFLRKVHAAFALPVAVVDGSTRAAWRGSTCRRASITRARMAAEPSPI